MWVLLKVSDVGWIERAMIYAENDVDQAVALATLKRITRPGVFEWLRQIIYRRRR